MSKFHEQLDLASDKTWSAPHLQQIDMQSTEAGMPPFPPQEIPMTPSETNPALAS